MKECKYCAAQMEDNSNFCPNCGNRWEEQAPQMQEMADPEAQELFTAEELKKICRNRGGDYDKHEELLMALLSRFKKDDS